MVAQTQNNKTMEELTIAQLQMIIGDALADVYYKTGNSPSQVLKAFEDKIRAEERESVLNELFQK